MIRTRVLVVVVLVSLVAALSAASAPAGATDPGVEPDLVVELWLTGVAIPWDIAFTPDGHALVPQRDSAEIVVRAPNGDTTTITANMNDVNSAGEGGLLGLVVDPGFADNRRFYTCQTTSSAVEVVSWQMNQAYTAATRVQDPLVGGINRTSGRHSGCRLRFGYEGYLWIATGDAANGVNPQSKSSLAGKVLRVDPETGKGHAKNPFVGVPGDNRIYSYGHRNIQGLDRRPCTNQMWTGEHGPDVNDEVNLIVKGGNYGWNPVPGYNESVSMTDFGLPGRQRGAKWRSGGSTVALSGVGWIRGSDWGAWDGELAGATLKNQRLMVFEFSNGSSLLDVDVPSELTGTFGRLRTAVMGPDGSLYVTSDGAGAVLRVTPAAGPTPGAQDINGDGFDDLIVGAPGENVRSRRNAGGFNTLFGGATGLNPAANGSEWRTQGHIRGAKPENADRLGAAVAYGDIDGDGITDIVVGSPGEAVGSAAGSGAIHVICGRTNGIEQRSSQTFSQAGSVPGAPEANDAFGHAVAIGDFNGDGYGDVIAGAPDEGISGMARAGAATVLYGTSAGLTTEGARNWNQSSVVPGAAQTGDQFGYSLAVGDFDADGFDDLALGSPGENSGGVIDAGEVWVLFGSEEGLTSSQSQQWSLNDAVGHPNSAGDQFGEVLVAGDFNNDGRDDLAIGLPHRDVDGKSNTGALVILNGSPSGLTAAGASFMTQDAPVPGINESGDAFASALVSADFDNDGFADLAVGSKGENQNRGRVVIFSGGAGGLVADATFSSKGAVAGASEVGDKFGATLRSGDFDNDGFMDLAIGVPGEDLGATKNAGAIVVLRGSGTGLRVTGSRQIHQGTNGVAGAKERGDRWGAL